ncbi:MAG: hypothetical protein HYZ16_11365 [Bacteroidetes bacterium]|nr:hypothetical protein [Bacteroidota bacterium]
MSTLPPLNIVRLVIDVLPLEMFILPFPPYPFRLMVTPLAFVTVAFMLMVPLIFRVVNVTPALKFASELILITSADARLSGGIPFASQFTGLFHALFGAAAPVKV